MRTSTVRMLRTIQELEKTGPRIAGTENDKKVTEYLVTRLRRCGLKVSTEEFPIVAFDGGHAGIWVDKPYTKEIRALPLIRSIPTPSGGVNGPLKYVGMGREEDFSQGDFTGSLVLADPPNVYGVHQGIKLENAARRRAVGLILCGAKPVECIPSWGGPRMGTPIPAATISYNDGNLLKKELEKRDLELRLEIDTSPRESQTANIIATVPGTKRKNEIIMISAHHDTVITPGANDNGSGLAVALELAMLFASEPCYRTLMFALFSAEEGGDIGSDIFVKRHQEDLIEKIQAVINIDMFAGEGKLSIVEKSRKADKWVMCTPWLNDFIMDKALSLGYKMDKYVNDCGTSDEGPFLEAGVPATWILKPDNPYYHTEEDNLKRINSRDLKAVADLVGTCLLDLGRKTLPLK